MAITKTHPIKSTLKHAIDYICNPSKTDGKLLVSSFGCAAALDMARNRHSGLQTKRLFDLCPDLDRASGINTAVAPTVKPT